MSGGPFNILGLGGGGVDYMDAMANPQMARQYAAQPQGILGGFNQFASQNTAGLLGLASGLLAGDTSAGLYGFAKGMEQDQRTRLIQRKEAEYEQKKVAAQQWAQKNGFDPAMAAADPDGVLNLAQNLEIKKRTPKELSFEQQQFNQLSKPEQEAYRRKHFLGETEGWKSVTVEDGLGGKRTLFQRGSQFATPEQLGIPGGSTSPKAVQQEEQRQQAASIVVQDIDRALDTIGQSDVKIGGYDTGINTATGRTGQVLGMVGGTNAHNVVALTNTIKANATFDKLQQMRQSSPTGAALGSVTDTDLKLLGSSIGDLENSQGKEQLQQNLKRVKKIYNEVIHGKGNVDDEGNPIRGAKAAVQGGPDRAALEAEARRRGLFR